MPKNIIDQNKQFEKNLSDSRHRLDLSTKSGRMLDSFLTPLYKKYGFLDDRMGLVDLNAKKIPDSAVSGLKNDLDSILEKLGIDMKWYKSVIVDKGLPTGHLHELSKLTGLYIHARNALQNVTKKIAYDKYTSGALAWDVYGLLHWVTDFEKQLNKIKQENSEQHLMHEKAIVEALQELFYHKPKKIISNPRKVAKQFNLDEFTVKEIFKKHIGKTPREYSTLIINEGLGDYLQHQGSKLANKVVQKYGVGQSKIAAQSKLKSLNDMNTVLTKWTEITQGNQAAATPQALKAFLTGQLKMDPTIVDNVIKKYKPTLVMTPADKQKAKTAQAPSEMSNFDKALNGLGPKMTSDDHVGESRQSIKEAYLPQNKLRSFFLDAINAQRQAILQPPKAKPVAPIQSTPQASAPTIKPSQPTQPTQTVAAKQAQQAPQQVSQQAAPKTKISVDDFKSAIENLPPSERANAITAALPALSDEEIKQVLTNLMTKKK